MKYSFALHLRYIIAVIFIKGSKEYLFETCSPRATLHYVREDRKSKARAKHPSASDWDITYLLFQEDKAKGYYK
jgi:hypothetical protein